MKSSEPLHALSAQIETTLADHKVRLTLGGEPTYVPVDPAGHEWSITALGPTKLRYAYALSDALIAQALPHAVAIYSPGKIYPGELNPVDDLAPQTVITRVSAQRDGALLVRGTTADNGVIKRVVVNECEARALRGNFAEWEATVPVVKVGAKLQAFAEDSAGNVEPRPHVLALVEKTWQPANRPLATR